MLNRRGQAVPAEGPVPRGTRTTDHRSEGVSHVVHPSPALAPRHLDHDATDDNSDGVTTTDTARRSLRRSVPVSLTDR
jgi:hypothetical protein